jgi:PEP-CTERM motif
VPVLVPEFPSTLRIRREVLVALAALAILLSAAPARAGTSPFVVFNPSSVNVTPGGTGSIELDLVNGGPAFDLGGFNIDIDVSPSAGVTFTGGSASTSDTYILSGNSSGPIVTNPDGPNTIELNDLANNGDQPVAPGTWGLAVFTFSVAPGTPVGPVTVTIDPATSFVDPSGSPISVDITTTGTINVSSVPEPSALAMAGLAAMAGLGVWARGRTARVRPL